MDGKAVFRFGVKVMGETALKALQRAGPTESDVDMLVRSNFERVFGPVRAEP